MASSIPAAADYAQALLTTRRAKNALVALVLACLLGQIALFLVYKYSPAMVLVGSTQPATEAAPVRLLHYGVSLSAFLGMVGSILLSLVLLLVLNILLVGRLLGTGRATSAFILSLVLMVLVFPWQTFVPRYSFTLPGVLYTWGELVADGKIDTGDAAVKVLKWARFAGFPGVSVALVLVIHSKSRRGLRQALGREPGEAAA